MKSFTPSEVMVAFGKAPEVIKDAFMSEETLQVIKGLQSKFQLHIDVAGTVGAEVGYLLVGLINPIEFGSRLRENGISEQVTRGITEEINQKIFVPLQQKMRQGGGGASQQAAGSRQPVTQSGSAPQRAAAPQMQKAMPAQEQPPRPQQPQRPPQQPFRTPQQVPRPPIDMPLRPRGAPPANLPGTEPAHLLPDHEEPHIEIENRRQVTGDREMPSQMRPQQQMPPRPLVTNVFPQAPRPPQPPAPQKTEPTPPGLPPLTKYNKDPYREPMDQ